MAQQQQNPQAILAASLQQSLRGNPLAGVITEAMDPVVKAFQTVSPLLGAAVQSLRAQFAQLNAALSAGVASVRSGGGSAGSPPPGAATGRQENVAGRISEELSNQFRSMPVAKTLSEAITPIVGIFGKIRTALAESELAFRGAGSTGASATSALSAVAGAALAIPQAFAQAAGMAQSFVQALNPAAVMMFSQALYDLQATVGVALEPIIQVATELARDLAANLLPVMRQLAPVIARISQIMGEVSATMFRLFASVLSALVPVLDLAASVLSVFAEILKPVIIMLTALVTVLKPIIEVVAGVLKGFANGLAVVIQTMAKVLIYLTAFLAKALGWDSLLDGLINGTKGEKEDAKGLGAARNVRFSSFAQYGKDVATASSTAGQSYNEKKPAEDYLKEIGATLQSIKDGTTTLSGVLKEAILDSGRKLISEFRSGVTEVAHRNPRTTGALLGQLAIPIPGVGALIGAGVGELLGG